MCLCVALLIALTACGTGGQAPPAPAPQPPPAEVSDPAPENEETEDLQEEYTPIESPEQYLASFPDADIIIGADGYFYPDATRVSWVNELDLSDATQVATVQRSGVTGDFQVWDATVLPEGTEIMRHNVEETVLVVEIDGELRPYLRYAAHS